MTRLHLGGGPNDAMSVAPTTSPAVRRDGRTPGKSLAAENEPLAWLEDDARPLDWNGPTDRAFTRFGDEDLDRPIIDRFERVARRHRGRIAIADADGSLSYGQLWDGVSGLAETIAGRTGPGDLIGLVLPASPLAPLAMLACLAAGRPFVALDPHYPGDWTRQVLEDARPALIIAGDDGFEGGMVGPGAARRIRLTGAPGPARDGWRPARLGVDQPACVLFTSGSTGRPKGVVNSQRNLLQRVAQSINAAHIDAEDRFLTLASLCTIVGVRDALTALLAGARLRLLDPQRAGAREILDVVRAEAITILFAFPALMRSVVASSRAPAGDALRLVRVGGDTTFWSDIDLLRAWLSPAAAIQVIYAATEAPMMQWFVDDACRTDEARVPIGYPLAGARLAVVGEDGRATAPGDVGELIVASPYVMLGLWTGGACVAEGVESAGAPPRRRFRTGDLVLQRPDGLLERIGRKDRQVKIRGARVDLDGVEALLRRHPLVRDVGALARTTGADEAVTLVAYVSAREGAPSGLLDELREAMRAAPAPLRPARLYQADEVPRLPSSKPDVRALKALDDANVRSEQARALGAASVGATSGDRIARTVAEAWAKVMHAPALGPEADFFDAGGDSLKAIALVIELEQALGVELSVTLVGEAPTFARLCEALRGGRPTRYAPLVPLKAGDGSPPVFFVHGAGGSVAELFPIARRMTWPGPVIGVQARGLAGPEPPHASVEAMATDYLPAMKALQPSGPYYLCGYSFGGLVAFEMARRLWEAGDEIGLVGLFDTSTSPLGWPLRVWAAVLRRRIVGFARRAAAARIRTWPRAAAAWIAGSVRGLQARDAPLPASLRSAPLKVLEVAASALAASARYRPGFYPGELKLFTPAGRDPSLPSLQSLWRGHAAALSVVETTGDHVTMLAAANAAPAAEALMRSLPKV